MTLSVRTELSHSYSYDSKVDAVFKITLVAEKQAEAKGFQHIIVLDTSHSMAGKKLELAKKGAQEYWSRIPTGNKVSFITFSDSVHTYPDTNLSTTLPGIKATGMTALYSALTTAFDLAAKSGGSGWILLLTDGHPTDVTKPEPYSALKTPQGFKMIEFGIGEIWGQVTMPEGFKGQLLNVQVSYGDAVDGSKQTINSSANIRPAKSDEEYTQGIRNSLMAEFAYYQGLEEYYRQLSAGKFKEATKTMTQLSSNAGQTQRADIIESTKRLSEQHEQTLRLGGGTENTNRLLKEAASESTKRTRGK